LLRRNILKIGIRTSWIIKKTSKNKNKKQRKNNKKKQFPFLKNKESFMAVVLH